MTTFIDDTGARSGPCVVDEGDVRRQRTIVGFG
jgi:hypothetical protein